MAKAYIIYGPKIFATRVALVNKKHEKVSSTWWQRAVVAEGNHGGIIAYVHTRLPCC